MKSIKRVLSLLLMVHLVGSAMGQSDSVLLIYSERYLQLSREFAKSPDNVANLMDMAEFYSQQDNPYYNLALAAGYAKRSEVLYTAWVQDKGRYRDMQKLIRKGITIPVIRQKRKDLESQAVLYVRSHIPQIDESEATALIDAFPDNAEIVKRLRAKVMADTYAKVRNENTIDGYYAFMQTYPNTAESDSAEAALLQLVPWYVSKFEDEKAVDSALSAYPASAALQLAGMRQKSRIAYLAASREDSEEAYSIYLENYPRGDYYMEALNRLQQLRRDDYDMLESPEELANFAQTHADSPLADSALARLRDMVVKQRNQHAAQIYLSQFSLDEKYSDVYRHYYEWYAEEGNGEPIRSFAAAHSDYPYKMAWNSDLARAAIIDSIDLTQPFQEADYGKMETNIRLLMGRKAAFVALQRILQQLIVHKDWATAQKRMQKFDLCFEDVNSAEYAELMAILSNNAAPVARLETPVSNISHAIVHPSGNRLYYPNIVDGVPTIGYARRIVTGKTTKWQHGGDIHIDGCDAPAVPYNFYDQGRKVLLGVAGDIWSADVESDSLWRIVEHFNSPVNTPYVEQDAYMLEDGTGILLVSDRPGGMNVQQSGSYYHGDRAPAFDIYYIPLLSASPSAQWGEAVNLGIGVNTPYCERSPILSRNMRTLYYVTDACGLGYGDIYCVTRTDIDDWTRWSQPINLGRGINGAFAETSLSLVQDEKRIFYLSGSQHSGKKACYSFVTRHDTASCRRQVAVDMTEVIDVLRQVELIDISRQRSLVTLEENDLDSISHFTLYRGKPYALLCEADWLYIPSFSLDANTQSIKSIHGYTLEELKSLPEPLPLSLVTFHGATAQMQALARQEMRNLAQFMRQHASSRIELYVHSRGVDDESAYALSLDRATTLRNYLVDNGIDTDRIILSAYGNVSYKQGGNLAPVGVRFL